MGVNFAIEFTYRVSNQRRQFSTNDHTVASIGAYLGHFGEDQLFEGLKDFALLVALSRTSSLPIKNSLNSLLHAIRDNDLLAFAQFSHSEDWLNTRTILTASAPPPGASSSGQFCYNEFRKKIFPNF